MLKLLNSGVSSSVDVQELIVAAAVPPAMVACELIELKEGASNDRF
jgi:hypothetical protein